MGLVYSEYLETGSFRIKLAAGVGGWAIRLSSLGIVILNHLEWCNGQEIQYLKTNQTPQRPDTVIPKCTVDIFSHPCIRMVWGLEIFSSLSLLPAFWTSSGVVPLGIRHGSSLVSTFLGSCASLAMWAMLNGNARRRYVCWQIQVIPATCNWKQKTFRDTIRYLL